MDGDGDGKPGKVEVEVIDIDMDSDDEDKDKDQEMDQHNNEKYNDRDMEERSRSPPVLTREVEIEVSTMTPSSSMSMHRSPGSASTATPAGAAGSTPKTGEKKRKRLSAAESAAYWKGREEKKLKLEEEKADKARKREEERIKREEEKRIKDEEKRLKDLKREEEKKLRDQKKLEEQQKKDEEKKKRDEEKRLRDEEKRKAEEEKQKVIQEKEKAKKKQEEIKAKQSQMLFKFLKKSPSTVTVQQQQRRITPLKITSSRVSSSSSALFTNHENDKDNPSPECNVSDDNIDYDNSFSALVMPFQIKSGMELAPLVRRKFTSIEKSHLDQYINGQRMLAGFDLKELVPLESNESFLISIKGGKGRKYPKTQVIQQQPDPDIEIISDESSNDNNIIDHKGAGLIKWRMKLLQFDENRRPPYWGTWKRFSKKVKPKVPLAKDSDLDYEVDSDDEWEDEPEDGEDLDLNSDKDEKDEDKDEEIEDEEDGWLVPHGYLSDDEGDLEDKVISKDELKIKEANFYKELEHKKKNRIALPIIDTDPRDFADLIPRLLYSNRPAMEPKPAISKKVQQQGPEIITVI